jgi:hypothetical protein
MMRLAAVRGKVHHSTSVPIPKFATVRGTLRSELQKSKDTSNSMILVRLFEFEVPKRMRLDMIGTSNSPH